MLGVAGDVDMYLFVQYFLLSWPDKKNFCLSKVCKIFFFKRRRFVFVLDIHYSAHESIIFVVRDVALCLVTVSAEVIRSKVQASLVRWYKELLFSVFDEKGDSRRVPSIYYLNPLIDEKRERFWLAKSILIFK